MYRTPNKNIESKESRLPSPFTPAVIAPTSSIENNDSSIKYHWTVKYGFLKTIFSFFLLIVIFVLGVYIYANIKLERVDFNYLRENWEKDFIHEIY